MFDNKFDGNIKVSRFYRIGIVSRSYKYSFFYVLSNGYFNYSTIVTIVIKTRNLNK